MFVALIMNIRKLSQRRCNDKMKSIGFPRMHKEESEKRDFLPLLFKRLGTFQDVDIFLEKEYGKGMGFKEEDYLKENPNLKFIEHEQIYKKDMIVVLRAPEEEEIKSMKQGAILVSMLHYETRALRNKLLVGKGIQCFSMDSMMDDYNNRMLVNFRGTSRTGVKVAFEELKKRMPNFYSPTRRPIYATVIGMGPVGLNAARALEEFSDKEFFYNLKELPGLIVRMFPRSITKNKNLLRKLMKDTDLLIDATKRPDPSEIIISNDLIGDLPEHAIILDLAADPYNEKINPIQVKGIEGIPTGTLDKIVIEKDDELYDTVPKQLDSSNRRVVVSCNAWPGVDPIDCMGIYGEQIYGFLKILIEKGVDNLRLESDDLHERALVRASLDYFLKNCCV